MVDFYRLGGGTIGRINLDYVKARLKLRFIYRQPQRRDFYDFFLLAEGDKFLCLCKISGFAELDLDKNHVFLVLRNDVNFAEAAGVVKTDYFIVLFLQEFCGGLLSEASDKLFVHAESSAKNFFKKDKRCIWQGP